MKRHFRLKSYRRQRPRRAHRSTYYHKAFDTIWYRFILVSVLNETFLTNTLKSVNSNSTPAVRSQKFGQTKTHFLSHFGGKKRKNMARPGFEPMISRSEVDRANHYSIGSSLENWQI